jgi:hypothetical protein
MQGVMHGSANEFANETVRDGRDTAIGQETALDTAAWSTRRAGTPETWKTCVVCLITQRSQVQILPPLQRCRSGALPGDRKGLLHVGC